jgi:restriction system protein
MGYFRYTYNVKHEGLGKYRVISGTDNALAKAKATALLQTWEAEYERKIAKEREKEEGIRSKEARLNEKEKRVQLLQRRQDEATERTDEAQAILKNIANTLRAALTSKHAVNWEKLKHNDSYSKPKPNEITYLEFPREPQTEDAKYRPALNLFDKFSKSRVEQKTQAANNLYLQDHAAWLETVEQIKAENQKRYSESVAAIEKWNAASLKYQEEQEQKNIVIDKRRTNYELLQPDAVADYCELVLSESEYPDNFPKEFHLEYNSNNKILIVDYSLPSPEKLPQIKEVKYIKAKDEFVEVLLSDADLNRNYDEVLYQICLRTLYELFDADVVGALSAIVFNGWVRSIDKATGNETNGCLLSVQAKKEELQNINLGNVEAKTCFKALKGVGSSQLHSLTPVAPVLNISREDKRFIASKDVAGQLDERFNLAAMDWEDFEHLIRELFEQEFNKNGGEVKVTQASRDGGVDAVAFDPDPIHGGKIVIQAKRYTNTVGVAAVRELYGTVLNEGAMKGILITTADYGPDAYEFAKGKPLTLMNGANLLYLLEKHGHKAKIDIKEAKMILGEKPF